MPGRLHHIAAVAKYQVTVAIEEVVAVDNNVGHSQLPISHLLQLRQHAREVHRVSVPPCPHVGHVVRRELA
eukprot:scaffold392952_cov42-Prasinocladus_malaysianus.AAC.2